MTKRAPSRAWGSRMTLLLNSFDRSRAVQTALSGASDRSPERLAATLAAVVAAGGPRADLIPLF